MDEIGIAGQPSLEHSLISRDKPLGRLVCVHPMQCAHIARTPFRNVGFLSSCRRGLVSRMLILPLGLDASGNPSVDLRGQPTIVPTALVKLKGLRKQTAGNKSVDM